MHNSCNLCASTITDDATFVKKNIMSAKFSCYNRHLAFKKYIICIALIPTWLYYGY